MKFQSFVNSNLKNGSGSWEGLPRVLNQDSGKYSYGYSQANLDASSPFAATKVSKCWIEANSDIRPGALITDRGDDTEWFVMSSRAQVTAGERCYWDATLYIVSNRFWVERFVEGAKDAFGRDLDATLTNIVFDKATGLIPAQIPAMVNPQSYGTNVQQDSIQEANKIRVAVQSKHAIQKNDRLRGADGYSYIVENIDRDSLGHNGLHILWVDEDIR